MTTIAANGRMMASDSLALRTEDGETYHVKKLFRANDAIIGVSGSYVDALRFVEWYQCGAGRGTQPKFEEYFVALVLTKDGICRYETSCIPITVLDEIAVAGSGASVAQTAMKLGKSPAEAVQLACELNAFTGAPVVAELLEPRKKGRRAKRAEEDVDRRGGVQRGDPRGLPFSGGGASLRGRRSGR